MTNTYKAIVISAGLCLAAGCASLGSRDDSYIPPPPKALSPIAQITAPDSASAIRAESLLVETARGMHESSVRGSWRFSDKPTYDKSLSNAEEELFRAREKARTAAVGDWSEAGDAEYTMLVNQSWGLLRTVLRSGDDVTIRTSIWPAAIRVVPGSARVIRVESDWVDLRKINPREVRCTKSTADPFHTPVSAANGGPAVRLIAGVEAAEARSKSAVTAGSEFRGVTSCEVSPIWRDRVAEFAFDVWMAADRAAKLGGPPLLRL